MYSLSLKKAAFFMRSYPETVYINFPACFISTAMSRYALQPGGACSIADK